MLCSSEAAANATSGIRTLRAAFTPDPDDAFAWWGIVSGQSTIPGFKVETTTRHIQEINEACLCEKFEIAAISSAAYPALSKNYAVLSSGASVGRGYGPALASKKLSLTDLERPVTVGIPGELTTGALLLRLFFPKAKTVSMRFDRVAQAILAGEIDAGVLIHEELLNWSAFGLRRLICLGQKWTEQTGLPLPIGLNVVRRSLGAELISRISFLIRDSMRLGNSNEREANEFAMRYSRQASPEIGGQFIKMFANDDTLELGSDCRVALRKLLEMAYDRGLTQCMPEIDII